MRLEPDETLCDTRKRIGPVDYAVRQREREGEREIDREAR